MIAIVAIMTILKKKCNLEIAIVAIMAILIKLNES